MIDIHTHILPQMDDGAQSVSESIDMLEIQKKRGVNKIILTPHYNPYDDINEFLIKREESYKLLSNRLGINNIEFKLGCEVLYSSKLLDLELDRLTLGESNYLLIEFGYGSNQSDIIRTFESLINSGYTPVLAHVERYSFIRDNLSLITELASLGVLLQFNAAAFIDKHDRNFVKACLKHNLVHLVASDAHNASNRAPNLQQAYAQLNESDVNFLKLNADKIFNNQRVQTKLPGKIRKVFGKYY